MTLFAGRISGGILVSVTILLSAYASAQDATGESLSAKDLVGHWSGATDMGELTASIRTGRRKPEFAVAQLTLRSSNQDCRGSATVYGKFNSNPVYAESYDPSSPRERICKVALKLHSPETLLVSEIDGCTSHRSARCEFSGILVRRGSEGDTGDPPPEPAGGIPDIDESSTQPDQDPIDAEVDTPEDPGSAESMPTPEPASAEPEPDQDAAAEPEESGAASAEKLLSGDPPVLAGSDDDRAAMVAAADSGLALVMAQAEIGGAPDREAASGVAAPADESEEHWIENIGRCEDTIGRKVASLSFDQAVALYRSVDPKDEFETTEQYKARLAAAGLATGPVVIEKAIEDKSFLRYDADGRKMLVGRSAFGDSPFDLQPAFLSAGAYMFLSGDHERNIHALVERGHETSGAYARFSASGGIENITSLFWKTKVIFEKLDTAGAGLFMGGVNGQHVLDELELSPDEARQLKTSAKAAFLVIPKAPFLLEGQYQVGRPTAQNPVDITESFSILVADIRCALLVDGNDRVLQAYPTR